MDKKRKTLAFATIAAATVLVLALPALALMPSIGASVFTSADQSPTPARGSASSSDDASSSSKKTNSLSDKEDAGKKGSDKADSSSSRGSSNEPKSSEDKSSDNCNDAANCATDAANNGEVGYTDYLGYCNADSGNETYAGGYVACCYGVSDRQYYGGGARSGASQGSGVQAKGAQDDGSSAPIDQGNDAQGDGTQDKDSKDNGSQPGQSSSDGPASQPASDDNSQDASDPSPSAPSEPTNPSASDPEPTPSTPEPSQPTEPAQPEPQKVWVDPIYEYRTVQPDTGTRYCAGANNGTEAGTCTESWAGTKDDTYDLRYDHWQAYVEQRTAEAAEAGVAYVCDHVHDDSKWVQDPAYTEEVLIQEGYWKET